MRALQIVRHGEPAEVLTMADVPAPEPAPGDVRVRVGAAALGLPDVMMCRGVYPITAPLPFTPGLEAAGVVVALGDGVDAALLGTRVVGVPAVPAGAFAEACIVPARGLYPVPDDVSDAAAAATHIAMTTSHVALHRRARLQAGETLVVHAAAGGTGSAAVQLGALAGARVIAVASGADRAAACRPLGAEIVVDTSTHDFVDVVNDATDGRGAEVVFDPVGGEVFDRSQQCIANEGRILLIGFAGGETQKIGAGRVLRGNYSVLGVYMGAYSRGDENRQFMLGVHEELMHLLAAGSIRAVVSEEIGLDGVPAALTRLGNRQVVGRVVVHPDQ